MALDLTGLTELDTGGLKSLDTEGLKPLDTSGLRAIEPERPDFSSKYNTALAPDEEPKFQAWRAKLPKNLQSERDYDLRGAFKAGVEASANGHFTDQFKKPNHPTFSNESQYAVGEDAAKAGRWDGDNFIPPAPAEEGETDEQRMARWRESDAVGAPIPGPGAKAPPGSLTVRPTVVGPAIVKGIGADLTQQVAGGQAMGEEAVARQLEQPAPEADTTSMAGGFARAMGGDAFMDTTDRAARARALRTSAGKHLATAAEADAAGNAALPPDASFAEKQLYGAGVSLAESLGALALGVASGPAGPVVAAGVMGAGQGAERYAQLRNLGRTEEEAGASAAKWMGLESLTEFLPGQTLLKKSAGFDGFKRKLAEFFLEEIPGENVTTIGEMVDDYALGLRDDITLADLAEAVRDTTIQTTLAGGAQAAGMHMLQTVQERANATAAVRANAPPAPAGRMSTDQVLDFVARRRAQLEAAPELAPAQQQELDFLRDHADKPVAVALAYRLDIEPNAALLTPGDIASPIPNDIIATGKAQVRDALAGTLVKPGETMGAPEEIPPITPTEAGNAQEVRGDQGQAGQGSPQGQPGLQPSPGERGGDLQQPAQAGPGTSNGPAQEAQGQAAAGADGLLAPLPIEQAPTLPAAGVKTPISNPDNNPIVMPEKANALRSLAAQAGWAEKGGKLIRTPEYEGDPNPPVTGRTAWVPRAEWWPGRPGGFNEKQTADIIEKGLSGKLLGKKQREYFDFLSGLADEMLKAPESLPTVDELKTAELEDTADDRFDVALVDRANQIDEGAVERAAVQYADDDHGFLQAIKQIVDQGAAPAEGRPAGARAPTDLFGQDTSQAQALADEQRRRDEQRNPNRDVSIETGDPTDLFSQARGQLDISSLTPVRPSGASLRGDKIDNEWRNFSKSSGTLGIPRADMPQIKAEHRGAMAQFLKARGIDGLHETVPATDLKPTQQEFSEAKVAKAKQFEGGDRSILVSADGYILDGHHQWMKAVDQHEDVNVIRLGAPIKDLLKIVPEFPSAEGGTPTVELKENEKPRAGERPIGTRVGKKLSKDTGTIKWYTDTTDGRRRAFVRFDQRTDGKPVESEYGNVYEAFVDVDKLKDVTPAAIGAKEPIPRDQPASEQSTAEAEPELDDSHTLSKDWTSNAADEARPSMYFEAIMSTEDNDIGEKWTKEKRARAKAAPGEADTAAWKKPLKVSVAQWKPRILDYLKNTNDSRPITLTRIAQDLAGVAEGNIIMDESPDHALWELIREGKAEWKVSDVTRPVWEQKNGRWRVVPGKTKPAQIVEFRAKATQSAVSPNTVFTEDAAAKARALLKSKLGQTNAGIDPEMLQAGIQLAGYHIERGARTFAAYSKAMIADLGEAIRPYLKSFYMAVKFDPRATEFASTMDSAAAVEAVAEGSEHVASVTGNLERDSGNAETPAPRNAATDEPAGGPAAESTRLPSADAGIRGGLDEGDARVRNGGAVTARESSDQPLHPDEGQRLLEGGAPGVDDDGRGDLFGDGGISPEQAGSDESEKALERVRDQREKLAAQEAANRLDVKPADKANIDATLPYLLPGQREDVKTAETRFEKPDGYGMLFTNGTGTGKTFTGLGVVRRYVSRGKRNVLIAAPSDKIMDDWIKSGRQLGLTINPLEDTKSAGHGITITTYANLGQNRTLADRSWDLLVGDEAHYLMQAKDAAPTDALATLRALTLHPEGTYRRTQMLHRDLADRMDQLKAEVDAKMRRFDDPELAKVYREFQAKHDAVAADVMANQLEKRPRALFLSATPFAYEKAVDWANGYLFDYGPVGSANESGRGYNGGSDRDRFFMQHFGYRMRFNKLTEPDAKVDRGVMQRQFNTWLKKQGVLSGRVLDVAADYDRRFVMIESKIGNRIDALLDWVRAYGDKLPETERRARDAINYVLKDKFDHLSRRYLLEAIKAEESIPYVKKHLEMGRKAVVFHDYKKGGGFNPFAITFEQAKLAYTAEHGAISDAALQAALNEYNKQFADVIKSDIGSMRSPLQAYQAEFPNVLLFNGDVPPKQRRANVEKFNDDATGPQVILVQSAAGKEGISLHDITGKHPRVLANLGLPTQPTTAIQQEGRTRRVGQVSDSMFRYFNTGTSWEKMAFATTIANRASAAENLAQGEQARALKDAFIAAFEEADEYPAGMEGEGKGGKERDKAANNALTEFDRAVAFYWGTEKKSARTKAREGKDYFATPEPVGLKMAEWAGIRPGEKALEPSAGHGAIARWFPTTSENTAIEPSNELVSRLSMVFDGAVRQMEFEELNVGANKFDAIVMNPPFGQGGSTAIEHLDKAVSHLRDRGRVVALIPTGPAADKKFDKWYEDRKGVYLSADIRLPNVTFERASTSVASRIVIFDKVDNINDLVGKPGLPNGIQRDLTGIDDIRELFKRIENMEMPPRPEPLVKPEDEKPAAKVETASATSDTYEAADTTHGKTGEPLYVARVKNRMERAAYDAENQRAKAMGGWYSAYRGKGAIPGFQFKDQAKRDAFIAGTAPAGDKAFSLGDENRDDLGFFSTLRAAVEGLKQEKGTAEQMLAMIRKTPGVKEDEITWTGLADWMKLQEQLGGRSFDADLIAEGHTLSPAQKKRIEANPGLVSKSAITKANILAFLEQNGVRVEETQLGGQSSTTRRRISDLQVKLDSLGFDVIYDPEDFLEAIHDRRGGRTYWYDGRNQTWSDQDDPDLPILENEAAIDAASQMRVAMLESADEEEQGTQFETWTLPGGTNYREVLLTLPPILKGANVRQTSDGRWMVTSESGSPSYGDTREQALDRYARQQADITTFRSSHFSEPNILAHVRLKDRTAADGSRVLFVEEIQSDWAQQGRKKGFAREPSELEREAMKLVPGKSWQSISAGDLRKAGASEDLQNRWMDHSQAVAEGRDGGMATVPRGPFVQNTDAWASLALKRVIRMAVDGGYDSVAWTTGEQQADRYNLAKVVDWIDYRPYLGMNTVGITLQARNGAIDISADRETGKIYAGYEDYKGKNLEDVIGKDLAQRILEAKTEGRLKSDDLRIGGDGMKAFYGDIVPKVANQVLKKIGGKLETIHLGKQESTEGISANYGTAEAGDQPGFKITPAMREHVSAKGLPLFAMTENARKRAMAAMDDLRRQLARVGISDRVALKLSDIIKDENGKEYPQARGAYSRAHRIIEIAMHTGDKSHVLDHEIIHALYDLGVIRDAEWRALKAKALADAPLMKMTRAKYEPLGLSESKIVEEAIAEMHANWADGKFKPVGFIRTALERIRNFFEALRNAWQGQGFQSADDIFRRIGRGEMGERLSGSVSRQPQPAFSLNEAGEPEFSPRAAAQIRRGEVPTFSNAESEARWQEARKGVAGQKGWFESLRERAEYIGQGFSRHFIHLPNTARFSPAREQLRKIEAAPQASKEEVVRTLRAITNGMSRDDLDLFTRKAVLDDLAYEVEQEHQLPFGFTSADVAHERAKLDAVLKERPDIRDRLDLRNKLAAKVANELVESGVLHKEQIKNPAYYRHQVLDYARAQVAYAKGTGKKLKTPHWARRMGSTLDINANLLEAEFEWMQKALTDIAVARTIEWFKDSDYNVRDQTIANAKANNDRLMQKLLEQDMKRNGYTTPTGRQTSPINESWLGFKQRIAMGLGQIRAALDKGLIDGIPAELQRVADDIVSQADSERSIFPFLAWILDNGKAGSMGAAMTFKAISQRKAFVKAMLGERYADPMQLDNLVKRGFAPEGYRTWQPDEGKLLFTAKTIPEHVVDRMISKLADEHAGPISADELRGAFESVRSMLSVGGPKYQLVIPEELADTLNNIKDNQADGLIDHLFAPPLAKWKQWTLINPHRVLKYNLNNLSGDLDAVIAGNPKALRQLPRAIRELRHVMLKGQTPSARYKEAVERAVFDSGLSVQEIPDINYLSEFEHLTDRSLGRTLSAPMAKTWAALKRYTGFRENWLRYATYLDYVERLERGESMQSIGYGAASREMVDAIEDPKDKAALLARELVGDYGAVSHFGREIRRKLIPFYSWLEINAKRYWRLGANAWDQGVGQGLRTSGLIGATLGARTTAYLGFRMAVIYALVQLWNNLVMGDDEDKLGAEERARLHLILGHNDQGEVMSLRFQGALSDFLDWFGLDDAVGMMSEIEQGRAGYEDLVGAMVKAPVNKLAGGITPLITTPIELLTGRDFWPDVFNPRVIRDNWRATAQLFSVDSEYDLIFDRPTRGYGRALTDTLAYRRDPGEAAYNRMKGMAHDWEARTKGDSGGGATTPRSSAMYDWRLAKKYGDKEAERAALQRMRELGVKREDLRSSLRNAHPLGSLSLKDRGAFLRTLSPRERQTLQDAIAWYKETYLND